MTHIDPNDKLFAGLALRQKAIYLGQYFNYSRTCIKRSDHPRGMAK